MRRRSLGNAKRPLAATFLAIGYSGLLGWIGRPEAADGDLKSLTSQNFDGDSDAVGERVCGGRSGRNRGMHKR
jgi:hypothetical protein